MIWLTDNDLKKYGKTYSLSKKAIALVNHQKANWPLATSNYPSLRKVQTRSFNFGHFRIDCQFNPERIRSSAANTDPAAIESRPCFLCADNRPAEQAAIPFGDHYAVLCNPFPIFPYHLTIPLHRHEPQFINGHIPDFLNLCRELQEFIVFYNGPRCGASAPDHFHFQAGVRGLLPLEDEIENLVIGHGQLIKSPGNLEIRAVDNYLRRFIWFRSDKQDTLEKWIEQSVLVLTEPDQKEEPMINILGWYANGYWEVVLFPRGAQRPSEYFADDFDRILVSPAAVELAGLVILPREEDFYKICSEDITSIFSQVTLPQSGFKHLTEKLIQTQ